MSVALNGGTLVADTRDEFLVNTQPHARNKTYRIVVRDLTKNVIVNQLAGAQVKRPWSMQVLTNGHLVIGYSLVRPFDFDFINDEGELYNRIESDSDKCFVLTNGLLVEVAGKQTIVKQVLPDFKQPRIVQVFDLAPQWVDVLDVDCLLAHTWLSDRNIGHLHVLRLSSKDIELSVPTTMANIVLKGNVAFGTTPGGDFVERLDLTNWVDSGITRTTTTPISVRRQKHNAIQLTLVNDTFLLYRNAQKQQAQNVESVTCHLIDWKKRQSIWSTTQSIRIIATSPRGLFVYFDEDSLSYFMLVCGSSVAIPIPALNHQKPKGTSCFLSNGTFVFHGEKRITVLDVDVATVLAQYDTSRHVCDLMSVSRHNYKARIVPELSTEDAKHADEIQAMILSTSAPFTVPTAVPATTASESLQASAPVTMAFESIVPQQVENKVAPPAPLAPTNPGPGASESSSSTSSTSSTSSASSTSSTSSASYCSIM